MHCKANRSLVQQDVKLYVQSPIKSLMTKYNRPFVLIQVDHLLDAGASDITADGASDTCPSLLDFVNTDQLNLI